MGRARRFEVVRLGHWSFGEMRLALGWDLERFVFFGGYPAGAALADDLEEVLSRPASELLA